MSLDKLQLNTVTTPTPSEMDKIRQPDLVITDGYLNDPIEYNPDERFYPTTVVKQFNELNSNRITRDFADFLKVDRNDDTEQLLTINMFSNTMNKIMYHRIMDDRSVFVDFVEPRD